MSLDIDIRGGPFDTWGGYGFSFVIKLFFSTPSLNVQFFSDCIKSKQFFISGKTQNNFFNHLFHLILHAPCKVLEVSPHLPALFIIFLDKESNCVE